MNHWEYSSTKKGQVVTNLMKITKMLDFSKKSHFWSQNSHLMVIIAKKYFRSSISLDHDLGSMVVLEFRFESYFWTCNGKNMVTSPWLTYRPSAGHNWPKTQILSSTKRQQVVNLTSFDYLWYSDFRLGVEKRSLPWLAVCDCCLIFSKTLAMLCTVKYEFFTSTKIDDCIKSSVY